MEKLAQLKEAEVCGVLSALVDKGLLPVNSPKQFEKVAAYMSNAVDGYDYSLVDLVGAAEDALKKTAGDDEKPAKSKGSRDLYAGIGAGIGAVSGAHSGMDMMRTALQKGWIRSPKSKLARGLLGAGAGLFVGTGLARAGHDTAGTLYDWKHKKEKAKE